MKLRGRLVVVAGLVLAAALTWIVLTAFTATAATTYPPPPPTSTPPPASRTADTGGDFGLPLRAGAVIASVGLGAAYIGRRRSDRFEGRA